MLKLVTLNLHSKEFPLNTSPYTRLCYQVIYFKPFTVNVGKSNTLKSLSMEILHSLFNELPDKEYKKIYKDEKWMRYEYEESFNGIPFYAEVSVDTSDNVDDLKMLKLSLETFSIKKFKESLASQEQIFQSISDKKQAYLEENTVKWLNKIVPYRNLKSTEELLKEAGNFSYLYLVNTINTLLVSLIRKDTNMVYFINNPETGLEGYSQVELANFFCYFVKEIEKNNSILVLETNSATMISALRANIKEGKLDRHEFLINRFEMNDSRKFIEIQECYLDRFGRYLNGEADNTEEAWFKMVGKLL